MIVGLCAKSKMNGDEVGIAESLLKPSDSPQMDVKPTHTISHHPLVAVLRLLVAGLS